MERRFCKTIWSTSRYTTNTRRNQTIIRNRNITKMIITTRNILTKSNLLDVISTYQIFSAYCKNFKQISKAFKSEFRDEKSPSCMIEYIGGDLLYTDFG